MAKKTGKSSETPAAVNKKAYHDFELVEKYEAGIELRGSEVKSLRAVAAWNRPTSSEYTRPH